MVLWSIVCLSDVPLCAVVISSRGIALYLANGYSTVESLYPKDAKTRAKVDCMLLYDVSTAYVNIRSHVVGRNSMRTMHVRF